VEGMEPTDKLFHYVDGYAVPGSKPLMVFDRLEHIFYPPVSGTKREGACFTVRKGHAKPRIPETEGAEELGNWHPLQHWAWTFRRREVFYSYDDATFLSALAAVCGCLSIVVPGAGLDREEWRERQPMLRMGVAYGREDFGHAFSTMPHVPWYLDAQIAEHAGDIDSFLQEVARA
jgi:hypothetical protein